MVYTTELFTDNSTISPMNPTPVKKPNARKQRCLFTNILDMKNIAAIRQVGDYIEPIPSIIILCFTPNASWC